MVKFTKTKRRRTDRYVEFRCKHRAFMPDGSMPDWEKSKCPTCGTRGITTEQASVFIHQALGGLI